MEIISVDIAADLPVELPKPVQDPAIEFRHLGGRKAFRFVETMKVAKQEGMKTLREDAWDKVLQGITSYQEIMRVTGEEYSD